jgi:hypothetical protein
MVPRLFFISRGVSLWFARAANERHLKFLVRCKSEKEVTDVLRHWATRQPSKQQSS